MYSLNVPVPAAVARLASDVAAELPGARARARDEHTLVCKRLGDPGAEGYGQASPRAGADDAVHRLEARLREALAGTPPFEARVDSVGVFADPPTGPAPVVYLAVESPGLREIHGRLCEHFDPVDAIEGDGYVPHVTVARGGDAAAARALEGNNIGPVEWAVEELVLHDGARSLPVTRFSLPA